MPGLHELQKRVGRAVRQQEIGPLDEDIEGDGLNPSARIQIYSNHYFTSLTDALQAIYPVVCRLVDERFFAFAAHEYIRSNPPRRVCLFEYGSDFPDFLEAFPPCSALPYLSDVARLEWQINTALHAPLEPPLLPDAFAQLRTEDYARIKLLLQPSLRYVSSPWPIDQIWRSNQPNAGSEAIDVSKGGCRLEVRQLGEDVIFQPIEPSEFNFRMALARGQFLEAVAEAMLTCDPMFNLTMALRRLLIEGLIVGFDLELFLAEVTS